MSARRFAAGTLAVCLLVVTATAGAAPAAYSSRLTAALAAATPAAEGGAERLNVWVHFAERDLAGAELAAALDEAARGLTARQRERRARMGQPVGAADLPLTRARVDAVTATGAVPRRESRWLNAASFAATPAQIARIATLPGVERIDLVGSLRAGPASPVPPRQVPADAQPADKSLGDLDYGASKSMIDGVNLLGLHQRGLSGAGVTIAVFDTGFDVGHECFQHLDVVGAWDFVSDDPDVSQQRNDPDGSSEHGTEVLGTLAGFSRGSLIGPAYGASVLLARTEDIGGETQIEEDNWVAAAEWAVDLGADVISSSIGYYNWYDWSEMDGQTAPITIAADMAALRGVVVVVGVGMMRLDADWPHILAPADGRFVVAVGLSDRDGFVSGWSSPGPTYDGRIKPDVLALGINNVAPIPWTEDLYYFVSGTDFSVPLVTGAAALLLEQAPGLTPLQVREALRETATRAIVPDNDYGWGVVDALGAAGYWAPLIDHTPLADQPLAVGDYIVDAHITSRGSLLDGAQAVYYRLDGGSWRRAPLTSTGLGDWTGTIPHQREGRLVEYYLTAAGEDGLTTNWPDVGTAAPFAFTIAADTAPPVLNHVPLTDQLATLWPPRVVVQASDASGVGTIELVYTVAGSVPFPPLPLTKGPLDWSVDFPFARGVLPPGTRLGYYLVARDAAPAPNFTSIGPFEFQVVESRGSVLLIDNHYGATKEADSETGSRGVPQVTAPDKVATPVVAGWLTDLGYEVDVVAARNLVAGDMLGHDVVFLTAGNYLAPLNFDELRSAIVNWSAGGGRLLIEGGEIAYRALENGDFGDFAAEVLHIGGYVTDDGFEYYPGSATADHILLNRPNALAVPLILHVPGFGYDWGAADVVSGVDPSATLVMHSAYGANTGGIVVYDDNTGPQAGQTVYLPFDINYMSEPEARKLIENAITYLTSSEPAGPSAIAGRITLAGSTDHGGATVSAGRGLSTVTAADGSFTLDGLWGGTYVITASRDGFSTESARIVLAEGEQVGDADLTLVPVRALDWVAWPNLAIPDADPDGVVSTIQVPAIGLVAGIRVEIDIAHFAIGNLVVELRDPSGRLVTLHNRTGSIADDLIGEWPTSLVVDGPGTLADFMGAPVTGGWTLTVRDLAFGATGNLRGWALHLLVADLPPLAAGDQPAAATRIIGNAPNPFNPRTTVRFETRQAGAVRLDVYDVRGQLVARLVDGTLPAGTHAAVWDDPQVASGVYFVRLVSGGVTEVHKMTLVR